MGIYNTYIWQIVIKDTNQLAFHSRHDVSCEASTPCYWCGRGNVSCRHSDIFTVADKRNINTDEYEHH